MNLTIKNTLLSISILSFGFAEGEQGIPVAPPMTPQTNVVPEPQIKGLEASKPIAEPSKETVQEKLHVEELKIAELKKEAAAVQSAPNTAPVAPQSSAPVEHPQAPAPAPAANAAPNQAMVAVPNSQAANPLRKWISKSPETLADYAKKQYARYVNMLCTMRSAKWFKVKGDELNMTEKKVRNWCEKAPSNNSAFKSTFTKAAFLPNETVIIKAIDDAGTILKGLEAGISYSLDAEKKPIKVVSNQTKRAFYKFYQKLNDLSMLITACKERKSVVKSFFLMVNDTVAPYHVENLFGLEEFMAPTIQADVAKENTENEQFYNVLEQKLKVLKSTYDNAKKALDPLGGYSRVDRLRFNAGKSLSSEQLDKMIVDLEIIIDQKLTQAVAFSKIKGLDAQMDQWWEPINTK
jgi:hypothetical protein